MPIFTSRKQKKDIKVAFDAGMLNIEVDGKSPQVFPLAWFPQLQGATDEEREDWDVTPTGIRWNKLNQEIAIKF